MYKLPISKKGMRKLAPFIALISSTFVFRLLGFAGWEYFNDWGVSLRFGVAVMFLLAASAHWGNKRADLIRMVPTVFSKPYLLVSLTGYLEIAGAIGILLPATAKIASVCLVVLLLVMFPANIYAAKNKLTLGSKPVTRLKQRAALQLIFITAVVVAGWYPF